MELAAVLRITIDCGAGTAMANEIEGPVVVEATLLRSGTVGLL